MKIFKFSHCHRFFKAWLIAIACQTGEVFSQPEQNFYYAPSHNPYILEDSQNGPWSLPPSQWQKQEDFPPSYNPSAQYPYSYENRQQYEQGPAISNQQWQSQFESQPYYYTPYFFENRQQMGRVSELDRDFSGFLNDDEI